MDRKISKTESQRIRGSRQRFNVLKELEFRTIEYLCPRMPHWVTPDIMTFTGIIGSLIIFVGLVAAVNHPAYLLLSVVGFAVQWLGDSLDGRLAYYRNTPRKWYGWALDINADWVSISIIGLGFYFYFPVFKELAFIFVLAYGGAMILSLLRYKLNGQYIIDKSNMGPTEFRILVSIVLILELFIPMSLIVFTAIASIALIIMNINDSKEVLDIGDRKDIKDKMDKAFSY